MWLSRDVKQTGLSCTVWPLEVVKVDSNFSLTSQERLKLEV